MRYPGECVVNVLCVGPNQKVKFRAVTSSRNDTVVIVNVNNYGILNDAIYFPIIRLPAAPSSPVRELLSSFRARTEIGAANPARLGVFALALSKHAKACGVRR